MVVHLATIHKVPGLPPCTAKAKLNAIWVQQLVLVQAVTYDSQ